ncbi:MAG: PLP-dependent aminotransferase family protein [Oscillospiraceae bacterium]|jgi:2-aminoadipate transaminase|nr:PLP-dependent aminotransferase family protein [Oscillospiraceae bacterium]
MNAFSERISSLQPGAIREILKFTADPSVISFAAGNPAPEAFPVETVAKITADIMKNEPVSALQYAVSEGYAPLRDWLKADLGKKGVFNAEDDDIIITAGAQQVTEIVTKLMCNEGETIICETPTFIGSLNAFRSYNAKLVGVPSDDDGINADKLEIALMDNPKTAFIYLIPNFQNPTGKTMSRERRRVVLRLAEKYNVLILEDNPYGDLRFTGIDIPSIKEFDKNRHVVYAGSFSKTLAPGLRVGFMCGAQNIVQKAVACVQVSTVHTSILPQMLTYKFVTEYNFDAHLERLQQIYKEKCKLMLDGLKFGMPLSVEFTEPEGGLFIWGTLPFGDMRYFCGKAAENKVAVVPGNAFLVNEKEESLSFRLNFSTPTNEQIERGVEILARVAKTIYR